MPASLRSAAPIFAALGDATRLRILARLSAGEPLSIAKLADGSGITRQAIAKHLHVLAEARLVRDARRGRERQWEFDPRRLDAARTALSAIAGEWDARLDRLKRYVEE